MSKCWIRIQIVGFGRENRMNLKVIGVFIVFFSPFCDESRSAMRRGTNQQIEFLFVSCQKKLYLIFKFEVIWKHFNIEKNRFDYSKILIQNEIGNQIQLRHSQTFCALQKPPLCPIVMHLTAQNASDPRMSQLMNWSTAGSEISEMKKVFN